MEVKTFALRKSVTVLKISTLIAVAVSAILAALGYFSLKNAGGILTGTITGMINYAFLAVTVARICADSKITVRQAKNRMRKSYAARMLMMSVFSLAAIIFIRVNPLLHAFFMPVPCIAVRTSRSFQWISK